MRLLSMEKIKLSDKALHAPASGFGVQWEHRGSGWQHCQLWFLFVFIPKCKKPNGTIFQFSLYSFWNKCTSLHWSTRFWYDAHKLPWQAGFPLLKGQTVSYVDHCDPAWLFSCLVFALRLLPHGEGLFCPGSQTGAAFFRVSIWQYLPIILLPSSSVVFSGFP